jgi:succinate dehydrogenase (ubiquinone) membrane anchor subunit
MISLHHKINLALLGLAPVAFVLSPSAMNMPIDLALGIALPVHGHIGMNMVVTDYAKKVVGKGGVGPARVALAGFTGVTLLGLLKLNLTGPGITETVKSVWRPKKD